MRIATLILSNETDNVVLEDSQEGDQAGHNLHCLHEDISLLRLRRVGLVVECRTSNSEVLGSTISLHVGSSKSNQTNNSAQTGNGDCSLL